MADKKYIGEPGKQDDPCWKGYEMVGMKKKGGRKVPNCVPEATDIIAKAKAAVAKKAGAKLKLDPDTGTPDHFTSAARRKKGLPEENDQWRGGTRARGYGKSKETSNRKDVGRYTSSRRDHPKDVTGGKLAAARLRMMRGEWPSLGESKIYSVHVKTYDSQGNKQMNSPEFKKHVSAHGGEVDYVSDKGAAFKFKSASNAAMFHRGVQSKFKELDSEHDMHEEADSKKYPRKGFPEPGDYGYHPNPGLKPQESDSDEDMDVAYKKATEKEGRKPLNAKVLEIDEALTRVTSGNKGYGYHGNVEARDDAEKDKRYSAMHRYAKKLVGDAGHLSDAKKPNVMVKHFLDSPHGRHIADNPTDKNITSRFAGFKKIYDPSMHEEVEQIDEISADMADRYLKGKRERDWKRSDDDDYSVPRRPQDTRRKNIDARGTSLALKTIYRPRNRVATEEVEEFDEVSKATMGRYINKAKDSIDSASYRQGHKEAHGSSSKALEKKLTKRHKGISTAVSKLTKEEQDFVDSLNNEIFEKADPYDIAGMIKKAKAKNDPNHPAMKHVAAIEDIKKHGGALSVQGDHVRSLIKALGEESMDNDMPKGLEDRAPRGRARNAMGRAIAKKERNLARARKEIASRNEEVENIDEISKDAALKYLSANKKDDAKARETGDYDRMTKRMRGTDMAVRKYTAKPGSKYVRVPATEEVEIAEARGRPRKAGAKDFTIHPKTKEKLMHNNPADMKRIERLQKNGVLEKPKVEAGQHIMNQLQKAKTSMLGGSKINFTHGDSKEVSGPHAAKILTKYAGMKPNEKEDFQKFVGHSHENLMKHV